MATQTQDVQEIVISNGGAENRGAGRKHRQKENGDWSDNDGSGYSTDDYGKRRRYDDSRYDDNRYDDDGYDDFGYDQDGYDRYGYNKYGYDRSGYDRDGYDKHGCDKSGYDKHGFDKYGYDRDGYDEYGCDRHGYDKDGYDRDGYDRNGRHKDGHYKHGHEKHYPKRAFETPLPKHGYFDGEIDAWVHEHGGYSPVSIIRTDQKWGVIVKWKTSGSLVRMICGTWCLQVHLESMGPGPELTLPRRAKKIELNPCAAKGHKNEVYYECHLDIPPGVVRAKHCSTPYKVVTTLTYLDPCGRPGPIAGYVEGQLLQFIRA